MGHFSVLKKIRTKRIVTRVIVALVILFVASILTYIRVPNEIKYFSATKNVFETSCDEYKEDQFFRGHLYFIYDWFAENSSAKYYLAPVTDSDGDDYYLIVYIPNKYEFEAANIIAQTQQYIQDGDDSQLDYDINCRGKMYDISDQTLEYLDQYLAYVDAPVSVRNNICDQMFCMIPTADAFSDRFFCWIFIDLIVLGISLWLLISAITCSFLKPLKKKLKAENMTLEDLEKEFEQPLAVFGKVLISSSHIFEMSDLYPFLRMDNILWTYPSVTRSSNGTSIFRAIFLTKNHLSVRFSTKSALDAEIICKWALQFQPNALYGYTQENSSMYYTRFNELLARVYNQTDGAQASVPATETPVAEPQSAADKNETHDYSNDILKPGI